MRTTTRATRVLFLMVLAGCQRVPPGGLARVVQFAPGKAEVGQDDLVGGIRIGFDRAVAADNSGGQLVTGPSTSTGRSSGRNALPSRAPRITMGAVGSAWNTQV